MRKKRFRIYISRWHVAATLFFLLAPFGFLLSFSRLFHIANTQLWADVLTSLIRMIIAYVMAATVGWILAVSFYRGKRALIVLPIFDVLQSFPTFAALPLVVYLWGASPAIVVFFLALEIIWPVFFSVVSMLKLMKHEWEEVTEVCRLGGLAYLRRFLWPVTLPAVITGSIIGLGDGWQALVATEIIVGLKSGLGNFFQGFSTNPTVTTLGILGFLLLIFSINKLLWLPMLEWSHRMMEE